MRRPLLKILLIRLRLIGDVVLTTPIIRALRRAYPDARLVYVVEPHAAAVVQGNPHLDEVLVAPLESGVARWRTDARLAWQLRRERFDIAVDFHGGPRSSLLALASGARRRIGYTVAGRSWMYTDVVPRPRGHRPHHSVLNQWELVQALLPGRPIPTPASDPVEMAEDAAAGARIEARLSAMHPNPAAEVVVVHVGAGNEFRRWPEEGFAEVVAALSSRRADRRIILTTGAAQVARAEMIQRLAVQRGIDPSAVTVMCDLDLAELRSLVARAALFVGGDSGPGHIAATTDTPMVVIFGPTTDVVWGPWRRPDLATEIVDAGELPCRPCDQRRCEPGDFRCLRAITPTTVVAAAERALERERRRVKVSGTTS